MTPLAEKLVRQIETSGPISVATFMGACLGDPDHGYYMRREAFGAAGDFVTAPEVSQMFGELVGLWAVATWELMGEPADFAFVELGPGRGTLMADMVRTALVKPDFLRAASYHLVEMSPRLRDVQKQTLAPTGLAFQWHERIDDIRRTPAIIVANEFFDALPVRQFQRHDGAWAERVIGLDDEGRLKIGLAPVERQPGGPDLPDGTIVEASPLGNAVMERLAGRLVADGGALLAIDYGAAQPGTGSTLQAVRDHTYQDPLDAPGEADLTAHVDFSALTRAARNGGAEPRPLMSQGEFLLRLGLVERAEVLGRGKDAATRDRVATAMKRLADPKAMGELFKAFAVGARGLRLPVFDPPPPTETGDSTGTAEPSGETETADKPAPQSTKAARKSGAKRKRSGKRKAKPSPGHDKDRPTRH